jgi:hypothetical protein
MRKRRRRLTCGPIIRDQVSVAARREVGMSSAAVLLTVAGVHSLALLGPGPNVLVVSHAAASRPRRAGVASPSAFPQARSSGRQRQPSDSRPCRTAPRASQRLSDRGRDFPDHPRDPSTQIPKHIRQPGRSHEPPPDLRVGSFADCSSISPTRSPSPSQAVFAALLAPNATISLRVAAVAVLLPMRSPGTRCRACLLH